MQLHRLRWTRVIAVALTLLAGAPGGFTTPATAEDCTLDELGVAVDEVGVSLRNYNQKTMPAILAKVQTLKERNGWSEDEYRAKAAEHMKDPELAALDRRANTLLSKIDALGPHEGDKDTDCARILELRATGRQLLEVMKAKTAYTHAKIDKELAAKTPPAATPTAKKEDAPSPTAKKNAVATPPKPASSKPTAPVADDQVAVRNPPPSDPGPWQTDVDVQPNPAGSQPKGYSIEEIRDATRGFFGTISTNLATVIEHAFKNWGRPTAYVLGNEGGGAFLAGLRYGEGTLYLRKGGRQKIYWHGPSVGYDIGAEGSRTMFLIYKLENPEGLYRTFTGIDGSAYLVGGVGITFLKGGKVVMAPIRTGVGLRLGANLGYVRFTPKATWNPF